MPVRDQARLMLDMAEKDLKALRGMRDPSVFADEIFGFHGQQAIEKALKAWLSLEGVAYPRTHDLIALLELLKNQGRDLSPYRDVVRFSVYAVQFRYEPYAPDEEPIDREQALGLTETLLAEVERIWRDAEGQGK